MVKAGWLFAQNVDGAPDMPAGVGGDVVNPLPIVRITGGPGGQEHTHLMAGSLAIHSDQIAIFHEHVITDVTGSWVQLTLPDSVATHQHTLQLDGNDNLVPDWFLCFWKGSDADAVTIATTPGIYIACQAEVAVVEGETVIGELDNTPWTAPELALWKARILNVLGLDMPAEVDRGKRLVELLVGILMSRPGQPEMALRFTS